MTKRRTGSGTITVAAFAALTAIFLAPEAARAQLAQGCGPVCIKTDYITVPLDPTPVSVCVAYQQVCASVRPLHNCKGSCKGRPRNIDASNGRVTITKYGRALGYTAANLSTFHPSGALARPLPGSANLRRPANNQLTGSDNKLTQTPTPPLSAASTSTTSATSNASLLKKH